MLSFALLAYGFAFRDADPDRALGATRLGLAIARDSGNRGTETSLALSLSRLEAKYGDPLAALDYFAVAIRNYHDSGNTTTIRVPLADLAAFFDRMGRHEPQSRLPVSRSIPSPPRGSLQFAPQSPTCALSLATRPTNPSPARARR